VSTGSASPFRSQTARARSAAAGLGLLAGAILLPLSLAAAPEFREQNVEVRLNGRLLVAGVIVRGASQREEVFVPAAGLALAIDGPPPRAQSRLRVEGESIFAARVGACRDCQVQVRRPVMISSRLRYIGGEVHLPLTDLVRAFEGKLSVDRAARVYTIFAGDCNWCVLEPRLY
jgi:hypothetical protein